MCKVTGHSSFECEFRPRRSYADSLNGAAAADPIAEKQSRPEINTIDLEAEFQRGIEASGPSQVTEREQSDTKMDQETNLKHPRIADNVSEESSGVPWCTPNRPKKSKIRKLTSSPISNSSADIPPSSTIFGLLSPGALMGGNASPSSMADMADQTDADPDPNDHSIV